MVLARVRIARMVPWETWTAAAISRWEKSAPAGAANGPLVFSVVFSLALDGACYVPQHVC